MTLDYKSFWDSKLFEEQFKRILVFLRGKDNIYLKMRITHLKAELERYRNTENGLLAKLQDLSRKIIEKTGILDTNHLLPTAGPQSTPPTSAEGTDLLRKNYGVFEGDRNWRYFETPLQKEPTLIIALPKTDPIEYLEELKEPYLSAIKHYFERIEYKIKKVRYLIDNTQYQIFLLQVILKQVSGKIETERLYDATKQVLESMEQYIVDITDDTSPTR